MSTTRMTSESGSSPANYCFRVGNKNRHHSAANLPLYSPAPGYSWKAESDGGPGGHAARSVIAEHILSAVLSSVTSGGIA